MLQFDVALSYSNLDSEDFDLLDSILERIPDAHLSRVDGCVRLRAFVVADCALNAVEFVAESVKASAPGSRPDDVHLDLVSVTEIAGMVGLNREAVRLWTAGKRGPGNFPKAFEVIGERTKVWAASDVWEWLTKQRIPHADARPLTPAEAIDGTRALERLRRKWAKIPTLTDSTHWRVAHRDQAIVPLRPRARSAS